MRIPSDARGAREGLHPLPIRLPEVQGNYELRYVTPQSRLVLARRPLKITAEEASLNAPESATAAIPILVGWEGPGNDYDQIALFAAEAAADVEPVRTATILSRRNPLPLNLPAEEGEFELRYLTAQTGRILARRPISIAPAGRLAVVFEEDGEICGAAEETGGASAVERFLDASGSMLQREGGVRRIDPGLKEDFEQWAQLGGGSYFDAGSADALSKSLRSVISGPFRVVDKDGKVAGTGVIGRNEERGSLILKKNRAQRANSLSFREHV
ncbi:MAG TPA: hypothetical protein VMN36_02145 [Verrucomicrobiales bacterium]|nr:hypothetical protein [Verrucomicrobiales bacterium]